jgi:hypothetical protein
MAEGPVSGTPSTRTGVPAWLLMTLVTVCAAVLLGACGSGPGSGSGPRHAPSHTVTLSLADNHETVQLHVPAAVTVRLPYVVKNPRRWELASGGAGMTLQSETAVTSKNKSAGTQVFDLKVTDRSSIPLIFVLEKPGPLTPNPAQRFSATLRSS